MLINYLRGTSYTPADIAAAVGKSIDEYDDNHDDAAIAEAFGLHVDACTCKDLDGWARLLTQYGPLYVGIKGNSHAVLITGLVSDGSAQGSRFHINDPWVGPLTTEAARLTEIYESIDEEAEFWIARK
jgi:hypothetical protein